MRFKDIIKKIGVGRFNCPSVIIAGTNGKGSCVSLLENIYINAGYKVGSFYSPHLFYFNERIRVNRKHIKNSSLIFLLKNIKNISEKHGLSFFQKITLTALVYLSKLRLDIIILEVGLGGRLDPVNAVDSHISAITSIGLDHQKLLGKTRKKIAEEKSGIYKFKKIAICGDEKPPKIIKEYAHKLQNKFYQIGREFNYVRCRNFCIWYQNLHSVYYNLPLPNIKMQNVATSLMALSSIHSIIPVKIDDISKGMVNTQLPGRFERFSLGVMDVSHNSESVKWLSEQILEESVLGRTLAIFSMLDERDLSSMLKHIIPTINFWYIPRLRNRTGKEPWKVAKYLKEKGVTNCAVFDSIESAMISCISSFKKGDFVVVFGSFHTVIEAKKLVYGS